MADYNECKGLIEELRLIVPGIDITGTSAGGHRRCNHAHYLDSLDPKMLLDCLQSLRKDATAEIVARDSRITQ
jgi:hypothetical protein